MIYVKDYIENEELTSQNIDLLSHPSQLTKYTWTKQSITIYRGKVLRGIALFCAREQTALCEEICKKRILKIQNKLGYDLPESQDYSLKKR